MKDLGSHIRWLLLIILLKGIFFAFFAWQFQEHWPDDRRVKGLFIEAGETVTFYEPLQNLSEGKGYTWIHGNKKELEPSTRRMPGLLPLYVPLDLVLGSASAKAAMVLLQFLIGCLAVYLLALLARDLFGSGWAFYLLLFLGIIESFASIYHHIGLGESLATSFCVFASFMLYRSFQRDGMSAPLLFISGLFATWAIFLRPPVGLLFPVIGLILWLHGRKHGLPFTLFLKKGMVFALPLILSIGAWSIRNQVVKGRFIPLEDNVYKSMPERYTPHLKALRGLIRAWGGDRKPWRPASEASWFDSQDAPPMEKIFSDHHYTQHFGPDSLKKLKRLFLKAEKGNRQASKEAVELARNYQRAYRQEKPFQYHVMARLRSLGRMLSIDNLKLPFPPLNEMGLYQKLIKGGYLLLANLILYTGLLGMLFFLIREREEVFALFSLYPILYVLILSICLFNVEDRYLVPLYPFFILFASYFFLWIAEKASGRELLEKDHSSR